MRRRNVRAFTSRQWAFVRWLGIGGSIFVVDPTRFDSEVEREWNRFPLPEYESQDVYLDRAVWEEHFRKVASRPTPPRTGVTVEDLSVPSLIDDHRIPVRVYRPTALVNGRGLVYVHGGGFTLGGLELEDENCYTWSKEAGCVIVSVDYRLAPEHHFPVPLEDCYSVLRWVADNADELAIDPRRLGVGGCSAGGALAAGLALLGRDRNGPEIALQMLLYPVLDASMSSASMRAISLRERDGSAQMWEYYLGQPPSEAPALAYASPAEADDLAGLPTTYIVAAEFDCLRDEAITYAQMLLNVGVSVELHVWAKVPHAFELFVPDASTARSSLQQQARAIARLLG